MKKLDNVKFWESTNFFDGIFRKLMSAGILLAATSVFMNANAGGATVGGYTVDVCKPAEYYSEISDPSSEPMRNFCSKQAIDSYKKFTQKDVNFGKNHVLIRIFKTSFVALEPATKKVYVIPYKITDSVVEDKAGRITFSKNGYDVCSVGDNTSFTSYSPLDYSGGDSAHPEYKLCVTLNKGLGFTDFYPVNIKTNEVPDPY